MAKFYTYICDRCRTRNESTSPDFPNNWASAKLERHGFGNIQDTKDLIWCDGCYYEAIRTLPQVQK